MYSINLKIGILLWFVDDFRVFIGTYVRFMYILKFFRHKKKAAHRAAFYQYNLEGLI